MVRRVLLRRLKNRRKYRKNLVHPGKIGEIERQLLNSPNNQTSKDRWLIKIIRSSNAWNWRPITSKKINNGQVTKGAKTAKMRRSSTAKTKTKEEKKQKVDRIAKQMKSWCTDAYKTIVFRPSTTITPSKSIWKQSIRWTTEIEMPITI